MPTWSSGFTLIEVLISMFILAVGLLGAGALQMAGLQTTMGAYNRSQATFLAADIADRMRGNREALAVYNGIDTNSPLTASTTCLTQAAGCSASQLAQANIVEWQGYFTNRNVLPAGRGRVANAGADRFLITITWNEREWNDDGYARTADDEKSYQLNVFLKND